MGRLSPGAHKYLSGFATAALFTVLYSYYVSRRSSQPYVKAPDDSVAEPPAASYEELVGNPMDSPKLVDYIRRKMLHPPSKVPYNLREPAKKHFSEYSQGQIVDTLIVKGKRNGFFLEAGAVDGETFSNSLYFERELGWTGLLIEPNPATYKLLQVKGRKAHTINCALSLNQRASKTQMRIAGPSGLLSKIKSGSGTGATTVTVKTVPLFSILLALNVSVIDYMSLDIEGSEMKVLKTIPWDKLTIHVIDVEVNKLKIPEDVNHLIRYMEERGYKYLGTKGVDAFFVSAEVWGTVLRGVNPLR
ncbi:protein Star-like [Macrobrachium rosenbergii]|uniref:protein Star-like n=1 Tax=Macrobrachium rosenbergii TaxID=79674 RepID=UPI0034D4E006